MTDEKVATKAPSNHRARFFNGGEVEYVNDWHNTDDVVSRGGIEYHYAGVSDGDAFYYREEKKDA